MEIIATHLVPANCSRQRIGDYLIGKWELLPSRKGIKKAIKKETILLNGQVAVTANWVSEGDRIELINTYRPPGKIYHTDLNVIHEDEAIAVINKPGGIPVSGNFFRSVYNALGYNLQIDQRAGFYPQPVHRLDSATSGLLLIAKTMAARIDLGKQFEAKKVTKKYQALVHGKVGGSGLINIPIDDKEATTFFELMDQRQTKKGDWISHLLLSPTTGRTHQLRKHCLYMGHPILGDKLYQRSGWQLQQKGLLLSATLLSFQHPATKEVIQFEVHPPAKFHRILHRP